MRKVGREGGDPLKQSDKGAAVNIRSYLIFKPFAESATSFNDNNTSSFE